MMKNLDYSIENGQLVVSELPSGHVIRRNVFDAPVLQILPLVQCRGCLVLLDPSESKKPTFENLFKIGCDGSINWTVKLPDSHDAFVRMIELDDYVEARTWTGQRVEIDLNSGETKKARFAK